MIRIAIHGAAGRMGRRLLALIAEDNQLQLAAAMDHPQHASQGQSVRSLSGAVSLPDITLGPSLDAPCDVVIDFSSPAGTQAILQTCVSKRLPLVIGTTGLTEDNHRVIDQSAKTIPVLQAPNMSLGVNLLLSLVGRVAQQLEGYDIEVTESHHRFKKDAPSGTAWGLVQSICQATGKDPTRDAAFGSYGPDPHNAPRQPGQIGVHALRMGDIVGDHTVIFAALGERLELRHIATDRDIFVRGALRAAKWLATKPAGRYSMADVLSD